MTIAFFDFDGTITTRDTLWEIIRFQKGSVRMYAGGCWLLPALIAYKCKLIPAQQMKEKVLAHFFGEMTEPDFAARCADFCTQRLPQLIRPAALKAIRQHQQEGHQVVVVTASVRQWVAPWCTALGIDCISSALDVQQQRITGKLAGANCNGAEKVRRIRQQFNLDNFREIYAYGDSSGDKPMLAIAQHAYFRLF
ncbi:HAD-IB family hydrolase [Chitinophaga nivalis]|uniref:HAD-IB family hydrolase n=1 Tax=Chitinophaga nivalis TaxID=2991709 RepID=A0ABT3IKW3_9BACT|nr:HAD-IB family hydrolase [Chitinophaga nivalis]MCW3484602.1 HAD-IB family hydrolase [Chitinophaga nivalis]